MRVSLPKMVLESAYAMHHGQGSGSTAVILAETFERHWRQLREIAAHNTAVPTSDDVVAILNLLDQMTSLLEMELMVENEQVQPADKLQVVNDCSLASGKKDDSSGPSSLSTTPCLDILLSENVLAHILAASKMPVSPDHQDMMRLQQLKVYEALLGGSSDGAKSLLENQSFLRPLLDLLRQFAKGNVVSHENDLRPRTKTKRDDRRTSPAIDETISAQTETHLLSLLNQLCFRLEEKEDEQLLDIFFNDRTNNPILSILVGYLHSDGVLGQHARDALLLCMSLSKKYPRVGRHITSESNFCPLLATGLSGLYSLLPRTMGGAVFSGPNCHRLSMNDVCQLPELKNFISTLEFCDAVIQVAHVGVKQYLLGLIYMGFLVPVLGPALTQTQEMELICSTVYVELFLRRINEASLLAIFLRFILTDSCDNKSIIDALVSRIGLQSQLCAVTLSLFETLVGLNCEDVMLWLVFRHLIPMIHLLPSQKTTIRQSDLHGRGSEKLLSLVPICCIEASLSNGDRDSSSSFSSGCPNASGLGTNSLTTVSQSNRAASLTSSTTVSLSLPTFLLGLGRQSVQSADSCRLDGDADAFPTSSSTNFLDYLVDARTAVRHRYKATKCWLYPYDGVQPPPQSLVVNSSSPATLKSASAICVDNLTTKSVLDELEEVDGGETARPADGGPVSLTEEEDEDFWKLITSPADNNAEAQSPEEIQGVIDPCQDALVLSKEQLPRLKSGANSLGLFLDLLLEKVELMPTNSFTVNLLVTGILSQLASYPQPLLRSVLIHPDVILQPSVRGLYAAIASLRQRIDAVMPTFPCGEEAIHLSRRFLSDRISPCSKRRDSNASLASAISHFGQEARTTKNSLSSAFSSMFRKKSTARLPEQPSVAPNSASTSFSFNKHSRQQISPEARQYALAAVILEEWLHEMAAIAHEQSNLEREQAYRMEIGIQSTITRPPNAD